MTSRTMHLGLALAAGVLLACGGGGGSGGGTGADLRTGRLTGAPVEGLRFSTATQVGETDASGTFQYRAGEDVSFHVGDVLVGQAPGADSLSPFDLAGTVPPIAARDVRRVLNRMEASPRGTPFEAAVNRAVFLQTLDEDGDPANGIRIPARMHALAAGAYVDFRSPTHRFVRNPQFRRLLAEGRSEGLWGGHRAVRKPSYALDGLYAGLGLSPQLHAVQERVDSGNADLRTRWTYDVHGNQTLKEEDYGADGTVDRRTVWTYDAQGNRILEEQDTNSDGHAERRTAWTFDADGNWTATELDDDADGTVDIRTTYTYDAVGQCTSVCEDTNADGVADRRSSHTYDADGRLRDSAHDTNGDGVADMRLVFTCDSAGNLILLERDDGADGTVDGRTVYAYDDRGNRTMEESDRDADGSAESLVSWTYDTDDRQRAAEFDSPPDGQVDSRSTQTYDSDGNLIRKDHDHNADGIPEALLVCTYDADGNRTEEQNVDSSGTVTHRTSLAPQPVGGWAFAFQ